MAEVWTSYTVAGEEDVVECRATIIVITLPPWSPGRELLIVDVSGLVTGENTISVLPANGDTINGAGGTGIVVAYGSIIFRASEKVPHVWTILAVGPGAGA